MNTKFYTEIESEMRILFSKIIPHLKYRNYDIYCSLKELAENREITIKSEKDLRMWIGKFRQMFYAVLSDLPPLVQKDVKFLHSVLIDYLLNYKLPDWQKHGDYWTSIKKD